MAYCQCPHCESSLYVIVEWDSVCCPFCGGKIVFPDCVTVDLVALEGKDPPDSS